MTDRYGTKMVLSELRGIADMARKLRHHFASSRPPAWAEYKLQRAKMALRGAVLKAAHGSGFETAANPEGYMVRSNLDQIAEDASWLAENLDPRAVLPEWFEHQVHTTHIDVDRVYTRFVRRDANPAMGCDHQGCRPLKECPKWAVEAFIDDRLDEGWKAPRDGGIADGRSVRDFHPVALAKGLCVELEHTSCWWKALRIAMDHIAEHPDYYEGLRRMEAELAAIKRRVLL